jgi:hypothetical protein
MSRRLRTHGTLAVALLLSLLLVLWVATGFAQGGANAEAPAAPDAGASSAPEALEPAVADAGAEQAQAGEAGALAPATEAADDAGADAGEAGPEPDDLTIEEKAYLYDLQRLTASPHRLSGTREAAAVAEYITHQLKRIGVEDVFALDMPVWQTTTERCDIELDGATLPLKPLRPNVIVPPVTPPEGLTGPLMYVGRGTLSDYGTRSALGAIVVIDYDSFDAWELAFALGAKAVVFLGDEAAVPSQPKHTGIPTNYVRLYASQRDLGGIDLRKDRAKVTVHSRVLWQNEIGRNVIARIRGTDPAYSPERTEPEAIVLAANYDTFGVVPEVSGGARGAANVAALLEAASKLRMQPPKRDVILMFLDNQARYHQGAREVYEALNMKADVHESLVKQHRAELQHVQVMRKMLEDHGLLFATATPPPGGVSPKVWLKRALAREANYARDDLRKELQVLRLNFGAGLEKTPQLARRDEQLEANGLRWDEVRRALHKDVLGNFVIQQRQDAKGTSVDARRAQAYLPIFERLRQSTLARFDRRIAELQAVLLIDTQRGKLREVLAPKDKPIWVVLHAHYNFSGGGPSWGVVVGDWTNQLFAHKTPKSEADTPGYYGRVLNAMSDVTASMKDVTLLDKRTLTDPTLGMTFAPGTFISSGFAAGAFGTYNVSLMTGYDRRPRDGHPSDRLAKLDWRMLRRQAEEGTKVLLALADSDGISLPQVFKAVVKTKYPDWSNGRSSGDYAGLQVSGSLAEDRPAAGAILALWPGNQWWSLQQGWLTMQKALEAPFFDPQVLEPVDENGRFRVVALRDDMHQELIATAALFREHGQVYAITTLEKLQQKLTETMRVNLLVANEHRWSLYRTYDSQPQMLRVLKASSDAPFRPNRSLWGQLGNDYFAYISDQIVDYELKIFQTMGPVALGEFTEKRPYGTGVERDRLLGSVYLSEQTAQDIWRLNEHRLGQLRSRGVTSADLELLHSRARRAQEQAKKEQDTSFREAGFARAAAISQRIYVPLRSTMDDLVHAIVLLLLLAIPFAFALERLVICATSIYGRIGGFTAMFLATFGMLFMMHPGFAIASTPIIIFLAFAILLLSSLVIYIVVRKFKTELKAIQGQAAGVHELEVSRMGTMLAAVGMGMSTMRRRPTRTTLTAITVVMLTFTILAFASFSRTVGVRAVYEGPASETTRSSILVRKLDYGAIPAGVADMLRGQEGPGGLIAPHYWLPRESASAQRSSIARTTDGESLTTDALMGVSVDELARWPELAAALGQGTLEEKQRALRDGGVFLPAIIQDVLKLERGDPVLLNGRRVTFAGTLNPTALQRLKHLDGESVLPVDFQDPTSMASGRTADSGEDNELIVTDDVDKDFVHLSSDQVVVASGELVRQLGGKLHALAFYPGEGIDVAERGRRIAEILVMPVWAVGPEGVERLILTVLTEVSGGLALFVPLLLGGLIIFGTLLGSISDREREIYTFSALGLSPGHVGVLFFAEATVYAVIGGMGGQLLAQCVALGASSLAKAGYIEPTSINYSSTNSLFAIGVVMLTVLVSAIYPAMRASRSANPGLARAWKMPPAEGDELKLTFPFTVSAYDITGVVSFLAEHFRRHDDAGLGGFAASNVAIRRTSQGNLELSSELALAPFDLGVTQHMTLTAIPSEIEGVDEVSIRVSRNSGALGDWYRANRVFMRDLRRQFLLWRTLTNDMIEHYRMETLQVLGVVDTEAKTPH